MPDTLTVTEIFYSIQGESTRAGMPCVFVRLTGCNLRCAWCDTQYALAGGRRMSIDQVIAEVGRHGCPLVQITGGEPLCQPESLELMRRLADLGFTVLLETNGSCDIGQADPRVVRVMDIKCPSSGQADRNLWSNIERLRPTDEVKFVLAGRPDFEWAVGVLRQYRLADRCIVLFSPVLDLLDPDALADWILTEGLPVRLQVQLHKLIWPADRRGV